MTKQELLDLGINDEVADKIVADYGKNYVKKADFNERLAELKESKNTVQELSEKQADLLKQLEDFKASGVEGSGDIAKLQKELEKLKADYESAEKARAEAEQKRINSEINMQLVDALSKHNAHDPNTVAELIAKNVSLGEDGAYTYNNAEGKAVSIEDGVKSFLESKPYMVRDTQKAGSGYNKGNNNNNGQPLSLQQAVANAMGINGGND